MITADSTKEVPVGLDNPETYLRSKNREILGSFAVPLEIATAAYKFYSKKAKAHSTRYLMSENTILSDCIKTYLKSDVGIERFGDLGTYTYIMDLAICELVLWWDGCGDKDLQEWCDTILSWERFLSLMPVFDFIMKRPEPEPYFSVGLRDIDIITKAIDEGIDVSILVSLID